VGKSTAVTTELRRERYGCPDWCTVDHEVADRDEEGVLAAPPYITHAGPAFGPEVGGWAVEITQYGAGPTQIYVGPGDEFLDEEVASALADALLLAADWMREQAPTPQSCALRPPHA
jgi:hypothetical protein